MIRFLFSLSSQYSQVAKSSQNILKQEALSVALP